MEQVWKEVVSEKASVSRQRETRISGLGMQYAIHNHTPLEGDYENAQSQSGTSRLGWRKMWLTAGTPLSE